MNFKTEYTPDAKWHTGSANIHDIEISEVVYTALIVPSDPNKVLKYMLRRFGFPIWQLYLNHIKL